jgi:NADPH:quinone reductase-like Zn-dependent oxidoreductase
MLAEAARALRVTEKALSADALAPRIVERSRPLPGPGEALVEVLAAAVNVSDAKAALGLMPHAVWPRITGRDYAGRVVEGPPEWRGTEVWGTGGDLGITRDGSHARWLLLPVEALSRKPAAVPMAAAGAVGVPFVTAWEGLRRAGLQAGQHVAVFGASGKVGQAAAQLARRAGAQVVTVDRSDAAGGAAAKVMDATGGRGADIAFNTVGSPWFQAALDSLAIGGTQVLISTIERSVPFDILPFYRRNLQLVGVDSLKLGAAACARILDTLAPGFADGSLRAFEVDGPLLALDEAPDAFRRVLAGACDRVVLAP